ncbi:hypothetical protein IU11_14075 [Cellulosimicrobium sp. MM]|nr:hypothetical protein IU11_14075 [Cellulosimicrobium sp. MM]
MHTLQEPPGVVDDAWRAVRAQERPVPLHVEPAGDHDGRPVRKVGPPVPCPGHDDGPRRRDGRAACGDLVDRHPHLVPVGRPRPRVGPRLDGGAHRPGEGRRRALVGQRGERSPRGELGPAREEDGGDAREDERHLPEHAHADR